MIGYSIVAIQLAADSFIGAKESSWFSLQLLNAKQNSEFNEKESASKFYNNVVSTPSEDDIKLTLGDLEAISKARSAIEGDEHYHKYACDGLYVVPMDKSGYLTFKEFSERK